jgi:hypothetical protein
LTQLADAGFSMARPCLGRPANREHAKAAVSFMIICLVVVVYLFNLVQGSMYGNLLQDLARSTKKILYSKGLLHIFLFFPFP